MEVKRFVHAEVKEKMLKGEQRRKDEGEREIKEGKLVHAKRKALIKRK